MRIPFVIFSLVAAVAVAQEDEEKRCDGASYKVPCADHPEIMALQTKKCQPYHILIARGTDEKPPGRQGNITKTICDQLGGAEKCGWENLDYPATNRFMSDTEWCRSADLGAKNGHEQIKDYVAKCPDTKMILLGYSQGASIMLDMMGGGGGPVFKCEQSTIEGFNRTASPGANIAAAVTFGSVRKCPGASYAVKGGRKTEGSATRSKEQCRGLDAYAEVLRDYCNENDSICASHGKHPDLKHHLTYMTQYSEEIVRYVVDTVTGKKPKSFAPSLHVVSEHYWLTGAVFFSLILSWSVLIFWTSLRKKLGQGPA